MRSSVRARVTFGATAIVFVLLVVVSVALAVQQRRSLTTGLDETLATEARTIAAAIGAGDLGEEIDPFVDDDAFALVTDDAGVVVAATAAPPGDDGYRVLVRRAGDLEVTVGAPTDDIDDSVRALMASLALVVPAATALLAALVWTLVGRTLRPVEAIRREVAAMGGHDLHRRVPEPRRDDEIGRLARTMNLMLERVDDAATRQARFVADASHELRTPLTRMRTEIEVDLAHPDGADPSATLRSALDEIESLQRLVDSLLALARSDARAPGRDEIVDLRELVPSGPGVHVSARPVHVSGDREQLARAIGNLVDNARRHAKERVDVVVGDGAVTVSDDGDGVPVEHRELIFERFARVDDARAAGDGGSGLGLAIARDVAERHGGTLTLEGSNRFVLRLPQVNAAATAATKSRP